MIRRLVKLIRHLKVGEVASVRMQILNKQGNVCAICSSPLKQGAKDCPTLDHNHETGFIRGVLHNSCNGIEGKIMVLAKRGHKGVSATDYIIGLGKYLETHTKPKWAYLHPQHKTPRQKKDAINKKQRELRAKKKAR